MLKLSDSQRDRLRGVVQELSNSMARTDAEREYQKEAVEALAEEISGDDKAKGKKLIRRMAKDYHKNQYHQTQDEMETYFDLYESVMNENSNP